MELTKRILTVIKGYCEKHHCHDCVFDDKTQSGECMEGDHCLFWKGPPENWSLGNTIKEDLGKTSITSELVCLRCWKHWKYTRPKSSSLKDVRCPRCGNVGSVMNPTPKGGGLRRNS